MQTRNMEIGKIVHGTMFSSMKMEFYYVFIKTEQN